MNYSKRALLFFSIAFLAAVLIYFFFHFEKINSQVGLPPQNQPQLQVAGEQPATEQPPQDQFNPKLLSWTLATSSAEWETRDSGVSFVFNDKIWTMGGLDGNKKVQADNKVIYWEAPHFNDIWTTEDGTTWNLEIEKAAWPPRRSMTVVNFLNKLWMFGGWSPITGYESDIWQSDDGINWTKVVSKAAWPAREGHTAEVFQGKIWMFGGVDYDKRETKNDVWYSEDGIDWHQATTTIPWSTRWDHATAVFKDKIFLAGGMDLKNGVFNDVWASSNGLNWELVTAHAPWAARQGHSLVVYKDKLWLIGKLGDKGEGGVNDIWYSDDGITWQKTETDPPWIGREDHSVVIFNDRIYVFEGMGSDWKWHNDVWVTTEQK